MNAINIIPLCILFLFTGCSTCLKNEPTSMPIIDSHLPAVFLFQIAGIDGVYVRGFKVVLDGPHVLVYEDLSSPLLQRKPSLVITPSEDKWRDFFQKDIIKKNLNKREMYTPDKQIYDGASWELVIISYSKNKSNDIVLFGTNSYPDDFNQIIEAISILLDHKIGDPTETAPSPF